LQIIDGKARLVSDLMCDGLGACMGECPEGAIEIEKREAEPYDEKKVMEIIAEKGKNTVIAHLKHLKDHGEFEFLKEAVTWLNQNQHKLNFDFNEVRNEVHQYKANAHGHHEKPQSIQSAHGGGCPGSAAVDFRSAPDNVKSFQMESPVSLESQLRQWPVQLHLLNPRASYFEKADVLLAADCVAFTIADFHQNYLKGKTLAIACPKLDSNQEVYLQKLISMINDSGINSLTVMIMQVPCCGGLIQMAKRALDEAHRKIPLKMIVVGIQGEILREEWA
jgi:ferredoxin